MMRDAPLSNQYLVSKEVQYCPDNTLVDEVEEGTKSDAREVNLAWSDFPCVLGFFIEISNKTCSLLNSAAIGFLL